jgi:hypothetical protein
LLAVDVIQTLSGQRFLEFKKIQCGEVHIKLPWQKLQSEPVVIQVKSLEVWIEEPEEALTLAPLPEALAGGGDNDEDKSDDDDGKDGKDGKKAKRSKYEAAWENCTLSIDLLSVTMQTRGKPGLSKPPAPLQFQLRGFSMCSVDERWQPGELADIVAPNKGKPVLVIRKLIQFREISLNVASPKPARVVPPEECASLAVVPFLKLGSESDTALRVELCFHRAARIGIFHQLHVNVQVGDANVDWLKEVYIDVMEAVEGVQWCLARAALVERAANPPLASALQSSDEIELPKSLVTSADMPHRPRAGSQPSSYIKRNRRLSVYEDDGFLEARTPRGAIPRPRSGSLSDHQWNDAEKLLEEIEKKMEEEAPDDEDLVGAVAKLDVLEKEPMAKVTATLHLDTFKLQLREVDYDAEVTTPESASPSKKRVGNRRARKFKIHQITLSGVDASFSSEKRKEKDVGTDSFSQYVAIRASIASFFFIDIFTGQVLVSQNMSNGSTDLLELKVNSVMDAKAGLQVPAQVDVSAQLAPLNLLVERTGFERFVGFVTSRLPEGPPPPPRESVELKAVEPKSLAVRVRVGALTLLFPAPEKIAFTHDAQLVVGPLLIDTLPLTGNETLRVKVGASAAAALVPVRFGDVPAGIETVLDNVDIQIFCEVRKYLSTLKDVLAMKVPHGNVYDPTHRVEVSIVVANVDLMLKEPLIASLVQGNLQILSLVDSWKANIAAEKAKKKTGKLKKQRQSQIFSNHELELSDGGKSEKAAETKEGKESSGKGGEVRQRSKSSKASNLASVSEGGDPVTPLRAPDSPATVVKSSGSTSKKRRGKSGASSRKGTPSNKDASPVKSSPKPELRANKSSPSPRVPRVVPPLALDRGNLSTSLDTAPPPASPVPPLKLQALTNKSSSSRGSPVPPLSLGSASTSPRSVPAPLSATGSGSADGSRASKIASRRSEAGIDERFLLYLTIVGAEDLEAMDVGGTSDPYCVIKVGGHKWETRRIERTLNPVWNAKYAIPLDNLDDEMRIEMWDWDRLASDDPMGDVVLPIASFDEGSAKKVTMPLVHNKFTLRVQQTISGTLTVRGEIELCDMAKYAAALEELKTQKAYVTTGLDPSAQTYTDGPLYGAPGRPSLEFVGGVQPLAWLTIPFLFRVIVTPGDAAIRVRGRRRVRDDDHPEGFVGGFNLLDIFERVSLEEWARHREAEDDELLTLSFNCINLAVEHYKRDQLKVQASIVRPTVHAYNSLLLMPVELHIEQTESTADVDDGDAEVTGGTHSVEFTYEVARPKKREEFPNQTLLRLIGLQVRVVERGQLSGPPMDALTTMTDEFLDRIDLDGSRAAAKEREASGSSALVSSSASEASAAAAAVAAASASGSVARSMFTGLLAQLVSKLDIGDTVFTLERCSDPGFEVVAPEFLVVAFSPADKRLIQARTTHIERKLVKAEKTLRERTFEYEARIATATEDRAFADSAAVEAKMALAMTQSERDDLHKQLQDKGKECAALENKVKAVTATYNAVLNLVPKAHNKYAAKRAAAGQAVPTGMGGLATATPGASATSGTPQSVEDIANENVRMQDELFKERQQNEELRQEMAQLRARLEDNTADAQLAELEHEIEIANARFAQAEEERERQIRELETHLLARDHAEDQMKRDIFELNERIFELQQSEQRKNRRGIKSVRMTQPDFNSKFFSNSSSTGEGGGAGGGDDGGAGGSLAPPRKSSNPKRNTTRVSPLSISVTPVPDEDGGPNSSRTSGAGGAQPAEGEGVVKGSRLVRRIQKAKNNVTPGALRKRADSSPAPSPRQSQVMTGGSSSSRGGSQIAVDADGASATADSAADAPSEEDEHDASDAESHSGESSSSSAVSDASSIDVHGRADRSPRMVGNQLKGALSLRTDRVRQKLTTAREQAAARAREANKGARRSESTRTPVAERIDEEEDVLVDDVGRRRSPRNAFSGASERFGGALAARRDKLAAARDRMNVRKPRVPVKLGRRSNVADLDYVAPPSVSLASSLPRSREDSPRSSASSVYGDDPSAQSSVQHSPRLHDSPSRNSLDDSGRFARDEVSASPSTDRRSGGRARGSGRRSAIHEGEPGAAAVKHVVPAGPTLSVDAAAGRSAARAAREKLAQKPTETRDLRTPREEETRGPVAKRASKANLDRLAAIGGSSSEDEAPSPTVAARYSRNSYSQRNLGPSREESDEDDFDQALREMQNDPVLRMGDGTSRELTADDFARLRDTPSPVEEEEAATPGTGNRLFGKFGRRRKGQGTDSSESIASVRDDSGAAVASPVAVTKGGNRLEPAALQPRYEVNSEDESLGGPEQDVFRISQVTVRSGDLIEVDFHFESWRPHSRDWIGLFNRLEKNNRKYVETVYKPVGAGKVYIRAPAKEGVYEARCFRGRSRKELYSPVATTSPLTVLPKR